MSFSKFSFVLSFVLFSITTKAASFPVNLPINASPNPFSGIANGDTIIITSVLNINASIAYAQTDLVFIIENNGAINWPNNNTFTIGNGGEVLINGNGGLTNTGACNANKLLTIGATNVARCNGASSTNSFAAVNTAGGVTQAGLFSLLSIQNEKFNISRNGLINQIQWTSNSTLPIKTIRLNYAYNQFEWYTIDTAEVNSNYVIYTFQHFQPENRNELYQIEVEFIDGTTQLSSVFNFNPSIKIEINVFPNPFVETIHIAGIEMNNYQLIILDMNGKTLREMNQIETNNIQLDLSDLEKGVYFIKIFNDKYSFIEKILKY
jgi:hypothetical protein